MLSHKLFKLLSAAFLISSCSPAIKPVQMSELKNQISNPVITRDNLFDYFRYDNSSSPWIGYIKFSIKLDESGQLSEVIWHPTQFPFHADYLKTLKEFEGLSSRDFDAFTLYKEGRKILLGTLLVPELYGSNSTDLPFGMQLISQTEVSPIGSGRALKAFSISG